MKKTLQGFLVALVLLLCNNEKAHAQITGVTVDSGYIYSQVTCLVPATAYLSVSGQIIGTPPANDSLTIYINWGDATDTTFKIAVGSGWFSTWPTHTYTIPGTFTPMIVGTTSNNLTDTLIDNSITISNNCAPMTGRLYVDANNDCMYNAGEAVVGHRAVKFFNTGTSQTYYAYTDNNGMYSYGVPPGNYTISLGTMPGALTPSCPASGTVSQTVVSGGSYTNNFAFSCNASAPVDLAVNAYAGNWRHGFDRALSLYVTSTNACTNSPATLTVTLPPDLSYTGVMPGGTAPTSVSGGTLTWNLANLSGLSNWSTYVLIHCSIATSIGDTLCVNATITPATPDANPANNTDVMCAIVSNSYDPNEKHVTPKGIGAAGNIINGTALTYLVNFQNTGNDVAYNVTITDSIDADLDISTLQVIKASHTMKPYITGDKMISFRFDNINLPDSGANEPASHGYVIYSISPKANLPLGTKITNTARIYFDYNDAIITNTTLNTIAAPQNVQQVASGTLKALVYPNPASGNIFIDVNGQANFKAELYDILGRKVKAIEGINGRAVISTKDVSGGTYVLRLTNEQNEVLVTKINVVQ